MPQSTAELYRRWKGPSDAKALGHLERKGFKLTKTFCWTRPHHGYHITEEDWSAINFLMQEWDYGSIIDHPSPPQSSR